MTKPIIGFIGLGIMGKPMARNLIKAGYTHLVHNHDKNRCQEPFIVPPPDPRGRRPFRKRLAPARQDRQSGNP